MYTKILAAAGTAAAVLGIATAALATSSPDATNGSGSSTSQHDKSAGHAKRHQLRRVLRHVLHGEVTTKGADGYVTHSGVRGSVTAVSATSITVKAADGFTETFTIDKTTRVRKRTSGQHGAADAALSDVKSGDAVAVMGRAPEHSSARPVARVVVDGLRK